jgi:D-alanine transaminase
MGIAWLNGDWLPLADARVSALDRGFLFADGIYEVTTVIGGRLIDLDAHLDRLARSAAEIGLPLREGRDAIAALHREIVAREALDEGVVYLQATRGADPERDFLPREGTAPTLLLFTQAKAIVANPAAETGIAVATVDDIRWARRDVKSVMLLAQVLAKREAAARGAQEAWMVADGLVTEGASSTAWIATADGRLVTRGHSTTTLPGVTALSIAALADEAGLAIDRRGFSVAEAQGAAEAFVTAASSLVLPVVSIDGAAVGDGRPGPIARRLRALYLDFARRG